jgi:alginate O-acetyltransferase complex protein AlgI
MSFTTWYYPFFLACIALIYWSVGHRSRIWLLLFASYIFYGAWDIRFLSLVAASTMIDYFCTTAMDGHRKESFKIFCGSFAPAVWLTILQKTGWGNASIQPWHLYSAFAVGGGFALIYQWIWSLTENKRRKSFLLLSIATNIAVLGFFKYFGFFVESAKALLHSAGLGTDFAIVTILLPVGVSFYTFQSIAFSVDVYLKKRTSCEDLPIFATFVAFFPQLVAGPIERGNQMLPQLQKHRTFEVINLQDGVRLILIGYFKKIFVANNCAIIADYVFNTPGSMNGYWIVLGIIAFAFQIYGDFSGYTDIARGSALFFGIRLERNFKFPYIAQSPSDFWARWHISLSSWFRDYIYIPLGGNRLGVLKTVRNLYITMLVAGLWHGSSWMFVLWGAYHATLLTLYRALPSLQLLEQSKGWNRIPAVLIMFILTLGGWLIFRSANLQLLTEALHALTIWPKDGISTITRPFIWVLIHIIPLLVLQFITRESEDESMLDHRRWWLRGWDYAFIFTLVTTSAVIDVEFIYFQF